MSLSKVLSHEGHDQEKPRILLYIYIYNSLFWAPN